MRILSGADASFDGDVVRAPGLRVGHLEQEPALDGATVLECVEPALARVRAMLDAFNQVSFDMSADGADFDALTKKMERLQNDLDACNGWEIDRQLEQAMDALR